MKNWQKTAPGQPANDPQPPPSGSTGTVALCVAVYILFWTMLILYLLRLHIRQRAVGRRIEELKTSLDTKTPTENADQEVLS